MCLREGMCQGVSALLEEALLISREMLRHAQLAEPRTQVVWPFLCFSSIPLFKTLQHCPYLDEPLLLVMFSESNV